MLYPGDPIKSSILQFLVEEKGLLAKQIVWKLEHEVGVQVSFQWVYKELVQLLEEGILVCYKDGYSISPLFKKNITGFVAQLHNRGSDILILELNEGDSIVRSFPSHLLAYNHLRLVAAEMLSCFSSENMNVYNFDHHFSSFFVPQGRGAIDLFLRKGNTFSVYLTGDSKFDKKTKFLMEGGHKQIRVFLKCQQSLLDPETEYLIYGDFIWTVSYPKGFVKEYDNIVEELDPDCIDIKYIVDFLSRKRGKFVLRFERNSVLAKELVRKMKKMGKR